MFIHIIKYTTMLAVSALFIADAFANSNFPSEKEGFESDVKPSFITGDWDVKTPDIKGSTQSLQAKEINHFESSEIKTVVNFTSNGELKFNYAVSSEENYDFLNFYIDGQLKLKVSGEKGWQLASFPVTPGKYTLSWKYEKDNIVTSGQDTAWIDNLTFSKESSKAKVTNVVFLTGRLPSSSNSFTEEVIKAQFNRTKALVERLSYGKQTLNLVTIRDLGVIDYSLKQVRQWSGTSSVIARLLRSEGRKPHSDQCKIDIEGPRAQKYLDNLPELEKAQSGITINTLDFSFIKKYLHKFPCRDISPGDILSIGQKFPSDINLKDVDIVVYSPFDDELHTGGLQNRLLSSGFILPNNITKEDRWRVRYVLSGATKKNIKKHYLVSVPGMSNALESSSTYLADKPYLQTNYSRITSHELIHALGIGTHDNGISYHTATNDVIKINEDPNYQPNLGYGDAFSIVGGALYSLGLAPSSREYLGWLTPERIHYITAADSGKSYTIQPFSRREGKVVAKVDLPSLKGHLYLSFEGNEEEYSTLKKSELANNSKGLILRFTKKREAGLLTTSILLDPDNDNKNNNFALKWREYFYIGNVTVVTDGIVDDKIHFRVYYR